MASEVLPVYGTTIRTGEFTRQAETNASLRAHDNSGFGPTVVNAKRDGTLAATVAAMGSVDIQTLLITEPMAVAATLTTPTNIDVHIAGEGEIVAGSGVIVTIDGDFQAPLRPVFTGAGSIAFGTNSPIRGVHPEWWPRTGSVDTTRLQAAADAAVSAGNFLGIPVLLSKKNYSIDSTVVFSQRYGASLIGATTGGSVLTWTGASTTTPMIRFDDCQLGDVRDFTIVPATGKTLAIGIQSINQTGANVSPGYLCFNRIRMVGSPGVLVRGFVLGGTGTIDGNNDFHILQGCQVVAATEAGYSIENSQCYSIYFLNCISAGCGRGLATSYATSATGGQFFAIGCEFSGSTVVDFSLQIPAGPCVISQCTAEGINKFLTMEPTGGGVAGDAAGLTIEHCRISTGGAFFSDADTIMSFNYAGPLILRNNYIGDQIHSTTGKDLRLNWNPGGGGTGRSFICEGNVFKVKTQITALTGIFNGTVPTRWSSNYQIYGTSSTQVLITPVHQFTGDTHFVSPVTEPFTVLATDTTPIAPDTSIHRFIYLAINNVNSGTDKTMTVSAPITGTGYTLRVGARLTFIFANGANSGDKIIAFNATFKKNWTPDMTAGKFNSITFAWSGAAWVQINATTGAV